MSSSFELEFTTFRLSHPMAELVGVKDNFQVTIPLHVRSAASIRAGDYLEVSAVAEGI